MPAPPSFAYSDGSTAVLRGHVALAVAACAKLARGHQDYRTLHPNVRELIEAGITALDDAGQAWMDTAGREQPRILAMRGEADSVGSTPVEDIGCEEAGVLLGVKPRQAAVLARRYHLGPEPGQGRPWRMRRDLVIALAERRRQEGARDGR